MADYVYLLECPNCEAAVEVAFGRRSNDTAAVEWRHDGCPNGGRSRRTGDAFVTSLPVDANGDLIPPEE